MARDWLRRNSIGACRYFLCRCFGSDWRNRREDAGSQNASSFGDGVNVAARLEGLAEPGGICVSARVQEDAAGRLDLTFDDLGEQSLKNIAGLVDLILIILVLFLLFGGGGY